MALADLFAPLAPEDEEELGLPAPELERPPEPVANDPTFNELFGFAEDDTDYDELFSRYGAQYDVDPTLLWGISEQESGRKLAAHGDKSLSPEGSKGIFQFYEPTVNSIRQRRPDFDPWNVEHATDETARMLREHYDTLAAEYPNALEEDLWRGAVAAHNSGIDPLRKDLFANTGYTKKVFGHINRRAPSPQPQEQGSLADLFAPLEAETEFAPSSRTEQPSVEALQRAGGGEPTTYPALPTGDEETGYWSNAARLAAERVTGLFGDLLGTAEDVATWAEDTLPTFALVNDEQGWRFVGGEEYRQMRDEGIPTPLGSAGEYWREKDFGGEARYVPDVIKGQWEQFDITDPETYAGLLEATAGYVGETGIQSAGDMVAVALNLPAYVVARSHEIGEERAKNDGREGQATLSDTIAAAPFAVASSLLERIGARGIGNAGREVTEQVLNEAVEYGFKQALKRIGAEGAKAAGKEAGTEFVQEGIIEYVGERLGTQAQMELAEAMERGGWGALAGGGYGGVAGAGVATARELTRDRLDTETGGITGDAEAAAINQAEPSRGSQKVPSQPEPVDPDVAAAIHATERQPTNAGAEVPSPEQGVGADADLDAVAAAANARTRDGEVDSGQARTPTEDGQPFEAGVSEAGETVVPPAAGSGPFDGGQAGQAGQPFSTAEEAELGERLRGAAEAARTPDRGDAEGAFQAGAEAEGRSVIDDFAELDRLSAENTALTELARAYAEVRGQAMSDRTRSQYIRELLDTTDPTEMLDRIYRRATAKVGSDTNRRIAARAYEALTGLNIAAEQRAGRPAMASERRGRAQPKPTPQQRRQDQRGAINEVIKRLHKPSQTDVLTAHDLTRSLDNANAVLKRRLAEARRTLSNLRKELVSSGRRLKALRQGEAGGRDIRQTRREIQNQIRKVQQAVKQVEAEQKNLDAAAKSVRAMRRGAVPAVVAARNVRKALGAMDRVSKGAAKRISEAVEKGTLGETAAKLHEETLATAEKEGALTPKQVARARDRRQGVKRASKRRAAHKAEKVAASEQQRAEKAQQRTEREQARTTAARRQRRAGVAPSARERERQQQRSKKQGTPPKMEDFREAERGWIDRTFGNLDPRSWTTKIRRAFLRINTLKRVRQKFAPLVDSVQIFLPKQRTEMGGTPQQVDTPYSALDAVVNAYGVRTLEQQQAVREANALLREIRKLPTNVRKQLSVAMAYATLHEIRPDKSRSDPVHKHLDALPDNLGDVRYRLAKAEWDKLGKLPKGKAAQQHFKDVLDYEHKARVDSLRNVVASMLYSQGIDLKAILGAKADHLLEKAADRDNAHKLLSDLQQELRAATAKVTAGQNAAITLPDAPVLTKADIIDAIELAAKTLDVAEIRGSYFPLRRQGQWVVEARSTYDITAPTQEELNAQIEKLLTGNPTLQIFKNRERDPLTGNYSAEVVDRVFELYPSEGDANARQQQLQKDDTYQSVNSVTSLDEWTPPRDSEIGQVFTRLRERLPEDPRTQQALREVMAQHIMKRDLARGMVNRKRVQGFSKDFEQSFASWASSQAVYSSNLELSPVETKAMAALRDQAEAMRLRGDPNAQAVLDLIGRLQNNRDVDAQVLTRWQQNLSKDLSDITTAVYLGSVGYSMLNSTQMVLTGFPYLSGKYGTLKTIGAMAKAFTDLTGLNWREAIPTVLSKAMRFRGAAQRILMDADTLAPTVKEIDGLMLTDRENKVLSDDEKRVMDNLRKTNDLSTKFAEYIQHSSLEAGVIRKGIDKVMNLIRALPEIIEYMNRGVVGLAAYRLEKDAATKEGKTKLGRYTDDLVKRGASRKEAREIAQQALAGEVEQNAAYEAAAAVNTSQFGYEEYNKPPIFRGIVKSNLFRFKMFPLGIYEYVGRIMGGMIYGGSVAPRGEMRTRILNWMDRTPAVPETINRTELVEQWLDKAGGKNTTNRAEIAKLMQDTGWFSEGVIEQVTKNTRAFTRKQAAGVLGNLMLIHWMAAGTSGILFEPIRLMMWALGQVMEDEEWLRDPDAWFYNWLSKEFGQDTAEVIVYGPVNYATGADLASRVSLGELALMDTPPDVTAGKAEWTQAVGEATGPTVSFFLTAFDIPKRLAEGEDPRLVFGSIAPKQIRDWLKAEVREEQGLTTGSGIPRMSAENFGPTEYWAQTLGFTPAKVKQHYDTRQRDEGYKGRIIKQRQRLMERYRRAWYSDDEAAVDEVLDEIFEWNERDDLPPKSVIGRDALKRIIRSAEKAAAEAEMRGGSVIGRGWDRPDTVR